MRNGHVMPHLERENWGGIPMEISSTLKNIPEADVRFSGLNL